MRRAGVLLAFLLLYLSALSASTAQPHKEILNDNAAFLLSGRKWYRGLKVMAAPHEDSKKDEVTEGKEAKSKDANSVHSNLGEKTVEVSIDGLSGESGGNNRKFVSPKEFDAEEFGPRPHPKKPQSVRG